MTDPKSELRKFERVFFKIEQNYQANLDMIIDKTKALVPVHILSLSEGGLSFGLQRDYNDLIDIDQTIPILYDRDTFPLESNGMFPFTVKYILNYEDYDYLLVGGKFDKITEIETDKIKKFVALNLKNLNDENSLNITGIK